MRAATSNNNKKNAKFIETGWKFHNDVATDLWKFGKIIRIYSNRAILRYPVNYSLNFLYFKRKM